MWNKHYRKNKKKKNKSKKKLKSGGTKEKTSRQDSKEFKSPNWFHASSLTTMRTLKTQLKIKSKSRLAKPGLAYKSELWIIKTSKRDLDLNIY